MSDSASLGSAKGSIELDVSSFSKGIAAAQKQLTGFGQATAGIGRGIGSAGAPLDDFASRADRASQALGRVSQSAAIFGGAIAVGVGAAVKSFASFEQQVNALGAVSGASTAQLKQLSDLALQIGKDTAFGATEAATALTELAKAGVPLETILAGTGRAAVDLAAATGTDLASAANILANVMNVFADSGIAAADAIDILTAAANASSADVGDLAAGLRVLGPVAANLGVDMADTAAAIAYFTNFGLKAADAGVSLARALDRAAAPTDEAATLMRELGIAVFDAQGEFVGFDQLFDNLQQSMSGLSDEQRTLAIATIFGAEAQDVINIAVSKGAAGYAELRGAVEPAGQAAEGAAARMKGLSGALDQARGSVETMSIAFGSALAPAIEFAAGLVESMADAFTALPGPIQATAAASIAAAGGLALVAAAVAKTISFALDSAAAFTRMATVIRNSAGAMRALSIAFNPITLGIAAIAAVTLIAIKRHRDHARAAKELQDALASLAKVANELALSGLTAEAKAAQETKANIESTLNVLAKEEERLRDAADAAQIHADALANGSAASLAAAESAKLLGEQAGRTAEAQKAIAKITPAITEALADQRLDTVKLANDFNFLVQQLQNGTITADGFIAAVTEMTTNTVRYQKGAEDAAETTEDLADATNESAEAAEKAAEEYAKFLDTVDDIARSTVQQIKGFEDASSELDGMQTAYRRAGESAEDMLLRMDRLNRIDLSDAEEEALHLSNHLLAAKADIERVTDSISENQDNMSMWEGRISGVTDVLGGNTETLDEWLGMLERGEVTQAEFNAAVDDGTAIGAFEKLDALLASGAINQEKYNEAKEAGLFLLKRSSGALADEREELVEDTIALAEYVKKHDEANGAVEGLSEAQRGFLAAMNSSAGATFLQTVQLLAYLAAIGLIPAEKVTDFIADASAADPIVAALAADIGLLPDKHETELTATGDPAIAAVDGVKDAIDGLDDKTVTVSVEVEQAAQAGLESIPGVGDLISIPTALEAPDTSAVTEAAPPEVAVPTTLDPPDDTALTGYKAETITVPTKLGPPDATALTDYKPPTITVPMEFGTPTGGQAEGEATAALTIPTILGAPDTTALDNYTAPTEIVPTKLGVPDASILGEVSAPTETIPTALGAPTTAALDDLILDPVIVPTIYGTPSFAEGAVLDGIDPIVISVDTTAADTAVTDLNTDLDTFGKRTDKSTLDATKQPFIDALNAVVGYGQEFRDDVFTASLDADSSPFDSALLAAYRYAQGFADSTFTSTLDINIQPALDKIAELAKNLPSSPAEKGPLSKVPSFAYVVNSFVDSMVAMEASARRSLSDVSAQLDNLSSLQAVKSSFSSDPLSWMLRGSLLSPVARGGGGTTVIDHSRTEVKWIALTESDLRRLAAEAARGGEAHDWIAGSARALSTMGG